MSESTISSEKDQSSTVSGIDGQMVADSPRFWRRNRHNRGDARNRPKLPEEFQSVSVYKSEGVNLPKKSMPERIKKLVQDKAEIDDDEAHRQLIERLSNRIRKKDPEFQLSGVSSDTTIKENVSPNVEPPVVKQEPIVIKQEATQSYEKVVTKRIPKKKTVNNEEPLLAFELDEPPIPTMRRRQPGPRSNLVAMFATESVKDSPSPLEVKIEPTKSHTISSPPDLSTGKYTDSAQKDDTRENPPILLSEKKSTEDSSGDDPGFFIKIIAMCVVICVVSIFVKFIFM